MNIAPNCSWSRCIRLVEEPKSLSRKALQLCPTRKLLRASFAGERVLAPRRPQPSISGRSSLRMNTMPPLRVEMGACREPGSAAW